MSAHAHVKSDLAFALIARTIAEQPEGTVVRFCAEVAQLLVTRPGEPETLLARLGWNTKGRRGRYIPKLIFV